jgi:4-hydroxybenzoate polyprenyltransferase
VIFAALIFSRNIFDTELFLKTFVVFVDFCFLSSGFYIVNDLLDIDSDRFHPVKKFRPIASGKLNKSAALISAVIMIAAGLSLASLFNSSYLVLVLVFLALNFAYSFYFKNVVILDVMVIAVGFVVRAAAGGEAIAVAISGWLFVCTLLLALFLGFSKRYGELMRHGQNTSNTRKVLEHYSKDLLNQAISIIAAATIAAYAIYTMSEETVNKFHSTNLKYTLFFVIYGILRYVYIIHKKEDGGEVPENSLLFDRSILINILLYVFAVVLIINR